MKQTIQQIVAAMVNQPGQFSFESGVTITRVEPDYAEGVLQVGPNSRNPQGNVHGGALVTLADTVAGCCACSRGRLCVTANVSMEFLRGSPRGPVLCVAVPKKMGRSLSVIAVTLTGPEREVLATGTYTFSMLPRSEASTDPGDLLPN